jgi:formiminotetrahydrofolate cyclodeaminase
VACGPSRPQREPCAAQSAALNVKINLAWIEDEGFKQEAWSRVETVLPETARLRDWVLALTYSRI